MMNYDLARRIRSAQQGRMARQSWDYVNQNDPDYPELCAMHQEMPSASTSEVREALKGLDLTSKEKE